MARGTFARDTDDTMLLQEKPTRTRTANDRGDLTAHFASDKIPVTAAARRALERQLVSLRESRQRDIPARLQIAREFGDAASNDEALAVREEEAVLAARIARLEDILGRATLVDHAGGHDTVAVGSRVSVLDFGTGDTREYTIEGAHGAIGKGVVSALSPVGRALLGRRRGERVSVELPNGRQRELEVREIRGARH